MFKTWFCSGKTTTYGCAFRQNMELVLCDCIHPVFLVLFCHAFGVALTDENNEVLVESDYWEILPIVGFRTRQTLKICLC
jgi:hypothetical protein